MTENSDPKGSDGADQLEEAERTEQLAEFRATGARAQGDKQGEEEHRRTAGAVDKARRDIKAGKPGDKKNGRRGKRPITDFRDRPPETPRTVICGTLATGKIRR
jgi:hypothetical protein